MKVEIKRRFEVIMMMSLKEAKELRDWMWERETPGDSRADASFNALAKAIEGIEE